MADCLGQRFEPYADRYTQLFFDNADTGYAEVCEFDLPLSKCLR